MDYKVNNIKSVYIIGALKNKNIPAVATQIEKAGFEVFADWFTPGPEADQFLLKYAKERGWSYRQALDSYAARNTFEFDKAHLDRCDAAVLVAPAGKSAHLELGYVRGQGKPGYVLFDKEPERFDVMYRFVSDIFFSVEDLIVGLNAPVIQIPKPGTVINVDESFWGGELKWRTPFLTRNK